MNSPSNNPFAYRIGERLLTLENVCITFGKPILQDISVKIDNIIRDGMHQGQVVCLLGPSGIGKTQLFRCIAGLQKPASGGVFINGVRKPVEPGDIGVVAQDYPLLKHRTVFGNLMLAARHKTPGEVEAQARVMKLLQDFGLNEQALYYPNELSGGQRQRVAIAQQLLCSSHFLLMDEPFSGLDPRAKQAVCETILQVSTADELNTTIVVTHDIEAAVKIADTIWVLGHDVDENGQPVPGARLKYHYDLISRGIAWHKEIENTPEFFQLCQELKQKFAEL